MLIKRLAWVTKQLQQQPLVFWCCCAVLILLCLVDFSRRLYVPAASAVDVQPFGMLPPWSAPETASYSALMQQWLNAEQQASAAADASTTSAKAPLLANAYAVGDKVIRLRAVFLSAAAGSRLALIEQQDIDNRQISFVQVRPGQVISHYIVTTINANYVEFSPEPSVSGEPAASPIRVYVFNPGV